MKNINPDIFTFYKDLDKNNNREWFHINLDSNH